MPINFSNPQDSGTPGIYVQEVSNGTRPIQAVGTRTAGFVGKAPWDKAPQNVAVLITNWTQFRTQFFPLSWEQEDQTNNPPQVNGKWMDLNRPNGLWTHLAHAVYGFFLNGGSRCYVVNIGDNSAITGDGEGLDVLGRIDEVAIVAAPGFTDAVNCKALIDHCDALRDRVAILDGPPFLQNAQIQSLGSEAPAPDQPALPADTSTPQPQPGDPTTAAEAQAAALQIWMANAMETTAHWSKPANSEYGQATLYVPWIQVSNPVRKSSLPTIYIPPSGHIAGVWARSDANRGVHKAPANEPLRGAVGLAYPFNDNEQGALNLHGVNVIRLFPNDGVLVWGARTLAKDPNFNYLNVRRLFNMIEESIAEGTRWIVFEPNDRPLWRAIRRDISAFLIGFWRDGALMGRTPEEAFFVKCDEENNPPETILLGQVNIDIGIAPVRPAEFVLFRISQYEAGSEVQVSGG